MVEALLTADVADGGLGHHHALEPGRHVAAGLAGRANAGHSHQVTQRDHTDAAAVVDDRQVPVVVRGQAGPGRVDALVGPEDIGAVGHPEPDRLTVGIAEAGRRPQQVPFGQDADDLVLVGHHDRARLGLLHPGGSGRQRVVRRAGHGGEVMRSRTMVSMSLHYDRAILRL